MARHAVIMPKTGLYTDDVRLLEWFAVDGAEVTVGQPLFAFETDKVTSEVEAEAAGFLRRLRQPDDMVPIGGEVGVIASNREEYEALLAEPMPTPTPAALLAPSPATGPAPSPPRTSAAPGLIVSPRARALLAEHGLTVADVADMRGTGPGGRIIDGDVRAWLDARASLPRVAERIPLRGRRAAIASRMHQSLATAAQLTSILELDVSPIVSWRAAEGSGTSHAAIFVKLAALALNRHPILNARLAEKEIEVYGDVNVAFAVDTDDGVIAPVVRAADTLSLADVDARVRELAEKARAHSLEPSDVEGATFTVSSSGSYPVDITTAILNPPQAGILWVGRIKNRPVAVDGHVVVRPTAQACLTFDHRVLDGAPAAEFLGSLEQLVEAFPEGFS
jgi:pyruvate dehydrogenase E2 component (dihydrolipoamide acetyltransferase)